MTPDTLYHVSPACVKESIELEGLKSNFGAVYASESPQDALGFMWFRLLDHMHHDGKKFTVLAHDRIDIWTIDTTQLDSSKLQPSVDHSSAFFGDATSWEYLGDIPASALVEYDYMTRQELEELTKVR